MFPPEKTRDRDPKPQTLSPVNSRLQTMSPKPQTKTYILIYQQRLKEDPLIQGALKISVDRALN